MAGKVRDEGRVSSENRGTRSRDRKGSCGFFPRHPTLDTLRISSCVLDLVEASHGTIDSEEAHLIPGGGSADQGSLLALALLSFLVGTASGLVGAAFRLSLDQADRWRGALIAWAHSGMFAGPLLVMVACAAATGVAAWLVRRYSPQASGSGIPHVELVLSGERPQAPYRLIPIKFIGGLLAIGSGLALGREGPSVQMGASVANLLGAVFGRNRR